MNEACVRLYRGLLIALRMGKLMPGWPWSKPQPQLRKLRFPVERHLGVDLADAHTVAHEIKPVQRVNLQRVLDRWTAEASSGVQSFGFSSSGYFSDDGLVKYLITDELIQAPIERVQLDSAPGETLDCVLRGLFLFRRAAVPVVLAFRPPRITSDLPILEVVAPTRETARDAVRHAG